MAEWVWGKVTNAVQDKIIASDNLASFSVLEHLILTSDLPLTTFSVYL